MLGGFVSSVICLIIGFLAGAVCLWYFGIHRKKFDVPS
jgi:ammonia channel protein AmtB